FGSLSDEVVQFLDICVKLRKNMIVSGGTSSGKTSLLGIVSALIPEDQRIIVIEDSAELQLQQEHVLPLESKPPDKHGKGEVTLIPQVLPLSTEGRYRVQDIYRVVRTGTDDGKILGEHRAAGNLPTFLEEIELSGFELPQSLKEIAARPEVRAAMEHK